MNEHDEKQKFAQTYIVAGCLIEQDGKYLLVQEKQPKVYGLWNFPAGHVDQGETIEQAAIREAKEESGFDVELEEKISLIQESADRPVKHIFKARIVGGSLSIPEEEILDAKWLLPGEIQKMHEEGKLRTEWIWEVVQKAQAAHTPHTPS